MKMVRHEYQEEEEPPQIVEKQQKKSTTTIRSKAVHFVSDLTTGLFNPISDKPSKSVPPNNSKHEDVAKSEDSKVGSTSEDDLESVNGPDTSSFPAFIYSLLSSSEPRSDSTTEKQHGNHEDMHEELPVPILRDSGKRKSLFSRGKSLGKSMYQAAKLGVRYQYSPKGSSNMIVDMKSNTKINAVEGPPKQNSNGTLSTKDLPETSESSLLLSDKFRLVLYAALPVLVQGRKWVLLYSTWKHGISLSTLYRRSILWPGPSLLVVGDRNGTVFGGLVEAPLKPSTKRGYQGSNSTFVFSNIPGHPEIYHATGANRYYTLCSTDHLALGGGSHFALFLDGDL
ncbi:hypothetical protein LIER_20800 [Lithospermum erythrorhizon]|uniref:Oxidation resistance protein 1 n=1 Tax=Lithospermum erythrorhizon TaxID=34254 RepID=A0AAV3QMW0_LITER